jgi:NADH-quinone oxidoreductase subunit C
VTPTDAVGRLREEFGVEPTAAGRLVTVEVPTAGWADLAAFARRALGCLYFNWLSAVDWKEAGFEVVCRVDNLDAGLALMMRTRLGPGQLRCPSLVGVWRGADWMERECYDMFGVAFDGHPDLRRILLPDDWDGHPLRKDYAVDAPHTPYR